MPNLLRGGLPNVNSYTASGSINQGDHVQLTSNSEEVEQADDEGDAGLGIAMYDAEDGQDVAVACVGAEVDQANIETAADVGDYLTQGGTDGRLKAAGDADDTIGVCTIDPADNQGGIHITGPSRNDNT